MSVAIPTANLSPAETPISPVDHVINERIRDAAAALWRAELLRASLQLFTAVIAGIVIWAIVDQWLYSPSPLVRAISLAGGCGGVLAYVFVQLVPLFRTQISSEYAARSLERDLPELRQGLLSYITLRGEIEAGNAPSAGLHTGAGLHNGIVRSLGAQAAGRLKSFDQVPSEATGTMNWWFAAIASVVCLLGYAALSPKDTLQSTQRLFAPLASIAAPRRVSIENVTPGDTEALAGQAVDISAEIRGLGRDDVPTIVWRSATQSADKPEQTELPFDKDTRRYRGTIQLDYTSTGEMQYELIAGDATAGPYRLSIQDVPVIVGISVHYVPPSYTGEKPYTRTGGAITSLSGSLVTVTATTNRPVTRAKIEFNPRSLGQSVQATAGSREMQVDEAGTGLTLAMPLKSVRGRAAAVELENYRIQVWDDAGQSSPNPIVYPIRVIEDLAPDVSIVVPQQTPKDVPIDAQQIIEVHAIDPDYGLKTIELELRRGIDVLANPVLWRDDRGASGNQVTEYRFRPSEHGLRVGDVVSVIAVASDNRSSDEDPSIEPNYSSTDAIQLKITMGEAPDGEPQLNDGLSKKDDSPAAGNDEKSQTGEQSGGGGAGGEGGAQSTAKGNSGGQSQSGNGSSKGETKQDEQGKSEGGKSGSNSPDNEPSEGSDPSNEGDASNSDNPSKSNPSNSNPSNSGKPAGGKPGGESESGNSTQNESPENMPPSDGNESSQFSNPNQGAEQYDAAGKSGKAESAGGGQSQPTSNQNPSDEGDENASDGSSASNNKDQAPEHDGEAFERIREHLNQKKADQGSKSQQDPNPQPDKNSGSGTGNQDAGSQDAGKPEASPSKSGKSDSSGTEPEKSHGDQSDADQSKGDQDAGESAGQSGTGKPNQDMSNEGKPQGDSNQTTGDDRQSGDSPSDQKNSGDQLPGEQNNAQQEDAKQNGAKPESGDSKAGDQKAGSDSGDGSQPANKPSDSAQSNPKSNSPTSNTAGESTDSTSDPSQTDSQAGNPETNPSKNGNPGDATQSSQSQQSSQPQQSSQSQSSGEGGAGAATGSDSGSGTGAPQTPVDAPDLEYTKKATDMVLDYLKETRDAPDRELLDKLKWTEDDLRRFSERWQSLREVRDVSPLGENREMKEALESLGMRPRGSATSNRSLEQDDLRGLRDSGARQAPPAALRDAFDAFRRAASRQNL